MSKFLMLVALTLLVTSAEATTKFKRAAVSNCRDATTGQYVSRAYAKKHPDTTVCEERK